MSKRKKIVKKKEDDLKKLNNVNGVLSVFNDDEIEIDEKIFEKINNLKNQKVKLELVKIKNHIGNPEIKDVNKLSKKLLKKELDKLYDLLGRNNIFVHFKNEYDLKEKYRFITEEVLEQKIEKLSNIDVSVKFIYEDFHPEKDIIDNEEEE